MEGADPELTPRRGAEAGSAPGVEPASGFQSPCRVCFGPEISLFCFCCGGGFCQGIARGQGRTFQNHSKIVISSSDLARDLRCFL